MAERRDVPAVHWALAVDLPRSRQVGAHLAGRVLVALAADVNAAGECWPSTENLAQSVSGVTRRDVRNALAILRDASLIVDVGRVGRAVRWRLAGYPAYGEGAGGEVPADEAAGYPADPVAATSAGYPADSPTGAAGTSAGASAGTSAGTLAGYPASKGKVKVRGKGLPPLTYTDQCSEHQDAPNNGPDQIPCGACGRARRAHDEATAQAARDRNERARTAPRCEVHTTESVPCRSCAGDHAAGQHDARPVRSCLKCTALAEVA